MLNSFIQLEAVAEGAAATLGNLSLSPEGRSAMRGTQAMQMVALAASRFQANAVIAEESAKISEQLTSA